MKQLNVHTQKIIIDFLDKKNDKKIIPIYIGIDVWKFVLDVSVLIWYTESLEYLWTIDNNITGFKQLENFILDLIWIGIDENNIFFACENTGVYTHDCMDYFDSRLTNTYILKSSLTFQARKYYAKADFKTDLLDSAIVALTLNDLHQKWKLECKENPYDKDKVWIWFVRRSFGKEMSSLRHIFRVLAELRNKKSELMTSILWLQYRIFPELELCFAYRSTTKRNIVNNFSRQDLLNMDFIEFVDKYKERFWSKSTTGKTKKKIKEFFDLVHERWEKTMHSDIDKLLGYDDNEFIQKNILIKSQEYDFVLREIEDVKSFAIKILCKLKENWYFIPQFKWISWSEMWIFLWELGNDIYDMNSSELLGFIWWHPNVYESGWWNPTKNPTFSNKKSIIKKYLYVWMWWFRMHNPIFRLYKDLLTEYYGITTEKSIMNFKLKKKINCKSGEKLLKIILISFKNKCGFDEVRFANDTIIPLINRLKTSGSNDETIKSIIKWTFGNKEIPQILVNFC